MNPSFSIPDDPYDKFVKVFNTLNTFKGFLDNVSALRFTALSALTTPGDPVEIAKKIQALADEIKKDAGWFGDLNSSIRYIIAAILIQNNDDFQSFMSEIRRVRSKFDEYNIRRSKMYEIMTILILRLNAQLNPISDDQIIRLKAIYEQMKKYHWWLTGPEDLPACAILSTRSEDVEFIGQRIEEIYQALCKKGFKEGDALQTAANILYLSDIEPKHIARRFFMLSEGFQNSSVAIWQSDYEELAILSFLDEQQKTVVETVIEIRKKLHDSSMFFDSTLSFNLAASIAFIELIAQNTEFKKIVDAKILVDMQNIINAQQAAMCAACASAASAGS